MLAHTGLSNEQFQHTERTLWCKSAEILYNWCCSILVHDHELCMTNPHALLQCLAVLAWIGWQVADQLLVKVLQSDMLSVEQHEKEMWHQHI